MPRTKSPSPLAEDAAPLGITAIEGEVAIDGGVITLAPGAAITVEQIPPLATAIEVLTKWADNPIVVKENVSVTVTHLLDIAPVNSKIVVTRFEGVVTATLATPDNTTALPKSDPASKLPEGAVIRKVAEGKFEAHQLSPAIEYPKLKTATAGEAISGFVPHFHRND